MSESTALLGGRAAIVCGASLGLGREIAAELVRHGASVMLCARDPIALEDAHAHLAPLAVGDARVLARPCDISDRAQVDALVAAAITAFPELDILVNSAGVYGPKGLVEANDWDAWVETIEINLYGTVLLCRALIPHLKRRNYGKIIQLSGGGATQPMPRLSAYATAKAAVVRFCETLAHELAPHAIDVNCIAPGALNTRMLDEIIAAGPDAVGETFFRKAVEQHASGGAPLARGAALAAWLASPASDGVTGRLISALWDPWDSLPLRRAELAGSDIYTLRRIVPADRGQGWGDKP